MKYLTGNSVEEFIKKADFLPDDISFDKTEPLANIKYLQLILAMVMIKNPENFKSINRWIHYTHSWRWSILGLYHYTLWNFSRTEYDPVESQNNSGGIPWKRIRDGITYWNYLTGTVITFNRMCQREPDIILSNLFGMPHLRIAHNLGLNL